MIYTGIGARRTPGAILHAMVGVAEYMARQGHTLRSGGAQGADRAFEIGADYKGIGNKEIYLPWKGFQNNNSPLHIVRQEAADVAALFHPAWDRLSDAGKRLMARNSYQMLGTDLRTKSDLVICWTPGGEVVGGTGQALRMAHYYNIPIFNLGSASLDVMEGRIVEFLDKRASQS
jgi:hypothetical protein